MACAVQVSKGLVVQVLSDEQVLHHVQHFLSLLSANEEVRHAIIGLLVRVIGDDTAKEAVNGFAKVGRHLNLHLSLTSASTYTQT